ncbi:alpha/beta hydrolase [Frondihabitans sp. PAMC 28766]|uniref:alpha/beta fold hydrolase n=1 Tax=Frondihabitans sp. PAMC 28766 TaxID=1795630 RepID=UPI00078BA4DC|nr:alpha/beta hydrolase [Frondihabitans sp. PAMC 28766]AMM19293.1 alpha/beta hydrolase [Frondihabitans sp. PAMC 28766]
MEPTVASFSSSVDSLGIATYSWPTTVEPPRGVIQIAHGIAEYALRYGRLAEALTSAGWVVYANDHRGHGESTSPAVALGSFGEAGWPALVQDVVTFSEQIRGSHPDLPLVLLGHSMGSFASQEVILDHSDLYAAVVLSGTTALDLLAQGLAESAGDGPVELTAFNAAFENRTGYEWLTRDEAEVDLYVADPRSGFDLADDTIPQLFASAARLGDPNALKGIDSTTPILVVSGQDDPLSGNGQLVETLADRYRDAGVTDVTLKVYPGARHEIFNEINRDEITQFVIDWLAERV